MDEKKLKIVKEIAENSLDCIDQVATWADKEIRQSRPITVVTPTAWDQKLSENIGQITRQKREKLVKLRDEPVIARVDYTCNDNGESKTIFVTRGETPDNVDGFTFANYNLPVGKIASRKVGDDFTLVNGRSVTIINKASLKPKKSNSVWDSHDNEIGIIEFDKSFVSSLREFLDKSSTLEEDFDVSWADESELSDDDLIKNVQHQVITHEGIRDQVILDEQQDRIFRLPINSRCFLSGPPGTGKTTTLIRRLCQKVDSEVLEKMDESEKSILKQASASSEEHKNNWIFFSPTELLRLSVQKAFAREGLAATDEQVCTWDKFCHNFARHDLRLLKIGDDTGPFRKRDNSDHLKKSATDDAKLWYSDFKAYYDNSTYNELLNDAEQLSFASDERISELGNLFLSIIKADHKTAYKKIIESSKEHIDVIADLIKDLNKQINKIINKAANSARSKEPNFREIFRDEVQRVLDVLAQESDDINDEDSEIDDDEIIEDNQTEKTVSVKRAGEFYQNSIKTAARSKFNRYKISEKSRTGMLIAWLGKERMPSDEDLQNLGELLDKQTRLRKFTRIERVLLNGVSSKYKRFRNKRIKDKSWYEQKPKSNSDICQSELDLIVLVYLQMVDKIESQESNLHYAQVLVDEATDFSAIQLACMYMLSHPAMRSFFICGDFNQRLTLDGIKSIDELLWIDGSIEQKKIIISYRQSQRLVNFAKEVASLGGSQKDDIVLPDKFSFDGVAPVWQSNLPDNISIAKWLVQRIREIDRSKPPTIAVLVNYEEQVEAVAKELHRQLEEISLSAVPCREGMVVGSDSDVRVFNIKHIKGLEFESVFFVGLDETVKTNPDLWHKYLYVGATRAAKYLGITFSGEIPVEVKELADHFASDWQKDS